MTSNPQTIVPFPSSVTARDRARIIRIARCLLRNNSIFRLSRQELARLARVTPQEISRQFRDRKSLIAAATKART